MRRWICITALIGLVALAAPAHAVAPDYGTESVSKAVGRSASCTRAAKALITATRHDYYLQSTAFRSISGVQLVASSVVMTYELPSHLATFTTTDAVRCSGTATRRGLSGSVPIWFSLTYAPDFSGIPFKKLKRLKTPPASRWSVVYQTSVDPGWSPAAPTSG